MKHPIQTYEALGHGSEAELLDAALDGLAYVDPSHGGGGKRAVLSGPWHCWKIPRALKGWRFGMA